MPSQTFEKIGEANYKHILTGKELNEVLPNLELYLVTYDGKPDRGITYRPGLNIDPNPFVHNRDSREHLFRLVEAHNIGYAIGGGCNGNYRDVVYRAKIPDNAKVVVFLDYIRVNMAVLSDKQIIRNNSSLLKLIVSTYPCGLEYTLRTGVQTEELAVEAAKVYGTSVHYANPLTRRVVATALKYNPWVINLDCIKKNEEFSELVKEVTEKLEEFKL